MIDIHCHFLPGIDDGPKTLEQSLEMARIATRNGISHSILTPHIHPGRYQNDRNLIKMAWQKFSSELEKAEIPLQTGFAAEVRVSPEVMTMVRDNAIPFYGELEGYKILLLEFPHSHIPPGSEKLVQWLLDQNIKPLIAHPERNRAVMRKYTKIEPFVQMGCLLQVTAGSLVGSFGEYAQVCAEHLLEQGWVSYLASDAHNDKHRSPRLDHGRKAAALIVGEEMAQQLVFAAPKVLVQSQFPLFEDASIL